MPPLAQAGPLPLGLVPVPHWVPVLWPQVQVEALVQGVHRALAEALARQSLVDPFLGGASSVQAQAQALLQRAEAQVLFVEVVAVVPWVVHPVRVLRVRRFRRHHHSHQHLHRPSVLPIR